MNSSTLATRSALVLDAEHPRLERLPDYSAGSSSVKIEREIAVSGNHADLTVGETVVFSGTMAAYMRSTLKNIQPADRKRHLLETLNAQIPNLDLQEAEVDQFDDLHAPLRLRLHYLLRQRCQVVGGQLVSRLPAPWERTLLAGTPLEKRAFPFRLWMPTVCESGVRVTSPSGWSPVLPEKRKLETPFCSGSLDARVGQHGLSLEGRVTQHPGEFAAGQYAAYLQAMTEAVAMVEQDVVFRRDSP